MKKILALLSIQAILSVAVYAQPSNDNCNTAVVLPVKPNECSTVYSATTVAATQSSQTALFGLYNDDDVWFKFTTPTAASIGSPGQSKIMIELSNISYPVGSSANFELEVREGANVCGNTYLVEYPISPTGGALPLYNLIPNTEYSIRIYTLNATSRINFDICVNQIAGPPTNDDCANATTIPLVANTGFVNENYGTQYASASSQSSGDATGKDDDVWYSFTTPATAMNAEVLLEGAALYAPVLEIWNNCASSTFSSWFTNDTLVTFSNLLPSTTYKIRLYTYGTSTRIPHFKITITLKPTPPVNNTFFTATLVNLSASNTCSTIITGGTTKDATADNLPTCIGTPTAATAKDVWYKFVPTTTSATIKLINKSLVSGTSNLMWLQVYESSNTNLKLCSDNNTADSIVFDGSTVAKTLTLGTTYYIRIYNHDSNSACTFDICNYLPKGPLYDECSNAVNIFVSTNEYCNNKVNISTVNSTTSSIAAPPCTSNVYNDIWVKFVAPTPIPSAGLAFVISNYQAVAGTNPNNRFAVYSGTCGSLSYLSCDALPTLVAGTTYYVRIFNTSGSGTGTFDVCLAPYPTAQTNITCATASSLISTADQSANYIFGTTYGLATSTSITDCFGNSGMPNKVLWYKFVATSTTHFVEFSDMINLDQNSNSIGYRVTTGICPSTTALSSPVCIFNVSFQNQTITGLTIGQTYFIEVMENTFNGGAVSFKLRVVGASTPINDEAVGSILTTQNPTCAEADGSFRFSTLSANVPASLGATYYQDVWYKFQAAATTATITLSGRLLQPRIALYNSAGTALIDAGAESYTYTATGLTIGALYNIRILNTSISSGVGSQADFKICVFGVPSTTLATGPTPSLCLANDNTVISNASNRWLHFTRGGNLIASVFDAVAMGNITAKYYINTGAIRSNTGVEYMDRNMEITPITQSTAPVNVRLYFTRDEFEHFVAANDGDGNDAYWLNDLKIAKFSGFACTDAITGSGEVLYGLAGFGSLSANVYYLEVVVPSFSSFFFKNVASSTVVPLICNNFNYKMLGNKVLLNWSAITETSNNYFEVQKSVDAINFKTIGIVNNKQDYNNNLYQYTDEFLTTNNSKTYYRLAAINKEGQKQITCKTLVVHSKNNSIAIGNVYPNPANNFVIADIPKPYIGNITVQIFNTVGQKVSEQKFEIGINDFQLKINTSSLSKGSYLVKFITTDETTTQQLTKL